MLFNSFEFIFFFLPLTLIVYYLIGSRKHHRIAVAWLVSASLFFYGWWNPAYLGLILLSIIFNYSLGLSLSRSNNSPSKAILIIGIIGNLGALGYFKYANFFIDNLNAFVGSRIYLEHIFLPLAISFFTFQQITYLVDAYKGETREYNFLHYCLFVTFFPQLIAGPIVHHKEMLPQFSRDRIYSFKPGPITIGLTIFAIGLFKKVVIADGVAVYSTPVFNAAEAGNAITFFEAWGGALAYTFQLYFDFSGYSDMAIGIARMFGIRLPLNFNSPYKSTSIIDFWRRWHMTLSRFLRDYLYIPLGGSRSGKTRRYVNLLITMLLGGLWHGAGWTFIAWGALHGFYLIINHAWRKIVLSIRPASTGKNSLLTKYSSLMLTFLCVVISWVFFRAETFNGALAMLKGMAGLNGAFLDARLAGIVPNFGGLITFEGLGMRYFGTVIGFIWIAVLLPVCLFAPNTQQIMQRYKPAFIIYKGEIERLRTKILIWRPTIPWALYTCALLSLSIISLTRVSEFLYFQF